MLTCAHHVLTMYGKVLLTIGDACVGARAPWHVLPERQQKFLMVNDWMCAQGGTCPVIWCTPCP